MAGLTPAAFLNYDIDMPRLTACLPCIPGIVISLQEFCLMAFGLCGIRLRQQAGPTVATLIATIYVC